MIVIVGGNARGVGKTTLVCGLIAALPEREWVAVKISGHPHGTPPLPPREAQPRATERFLAAGAAEAHLLRDTPEDRARLEQLVAGRRDVIVESNRAVEWIGFDAYLFLLDEQAPHPKPPERCHLNKAAWILPPRQDAPPAVLGALRLALAGGLRNADGL